MFTRIFTSDWVATSIFLVSGIIATLVLVFGNLTYFGDAGTYLQYAHYLTQFFFPDGLYYRTPAYPLLIILSGYLVTKSFSILLVMQALCAALIPLIVYKTLLPLSRKIAFVAAYVMIFSFLPFIFQMLIYPDQMHMFLSLLFSLACVAYYLAPDSARKAIFMYGVLFFLSFSRPTVIVFVIFPLFILALNKFANKRRQIVVHAVCLAVILGAHGIVAVKKERDAAANHKIVRSFNGKQLFYNVYMHSGQYEKPFARENGPATARFRDAFEAFFKDKGEGTYVEAGPGTLHPKKVLIFDWRNVKEGDALYKQYWEPYLNDPVAMVDQLLGHPDKILYFGVITDFADFVIGVEGDGLLRDMAIEQVYAQPALFRDIVKDNVGPFHWMPNWDEKRNRPINLGLNLLTYVSPPEEPSIHDLSDRVKAEVTTRYFAMEPTLAQEIMFGWLAVLAPVLRVCLLLCAIGVAVCIFRAVRRTPLRASGAIFIIAFSVFIGQSVPISLLADPSFRYQAGMGALSIPAAAAACAVLLESLKSRCFVRF